VVKEQVLDWNNSEAGARANSDASLGEQIQVIPTQTERENVLVGNEHGLMGRFGQNVGHVMGEVNQACGLPIRFADYQAGKSSIEGPKYQTRTIPDLILTNSQNEICAVGEGKTFWTKDLANVPRRLLASWLGKSLFWYSDYERFAQVSRSICKVYG
jgi:hypothetical protein